MRPLRCLDFFAGLGGWSAPFRERGHEVLTLDYDRRFAVDFCEDILTWDPASLPWRPDIVLASPDCTGFTVMNIGKNWTRPTDDPPNAPKTDSARMALRLVERTRELLAVLEPSFFVIENPVDKLRRLPVVSDLERQTVWYCHLGETNAKPTDLWGGFPPSLGLPPVCHARREGHAADCCCADHAAAPRGSKTPGSVQGVQGKNADAIRSEIPFELALRVCLAAERDFAEGLSHHDRKPAAPPPPILRIMGSGEEPEPEDAERQEALW